MWTLCAILTETDTFPVDSPARTANLTARLAEADWFYFPYPGLSRIAKGIFVDPIYSSEVIYSPKYSYFKFIFIYSEIISQPSNYTAHNNPKSRFSRLDWHVYLFYLFYQWRGQIQFKITNYYDYISMDFELLRQFQIIYRVSSALYIAHVIHDNYYHV